MLFAAVAVVWLIAGLFYRKIGSPAEVFVAHLTGLAIGIIVWVIAASGERFWTDRWESLPQILTVSLFPTTIVSMLYALMRQPRSRR
ncbi:MAG: hypothetical protein LLG00_14630 [Planctomycetaceae bacterium]|nr:hypothetical protein [Planctomycetaceae bacterium]